MSAVRPSSHPFQRYVSLPSQQFSPAVRILLDHAFDDAVFEIRAA